ncbi:PAS domain-containing sensor histidine kinase [Methanospirillum hungatei]|uniref:PAS domain-containing sensor histidine kinase n=1 Tax=Methanospirillum hungatei TaxID=2203 RepID=UPI0026E9326E|nr:PAS domain-containing sensor histidine kinase [Methanospirillum hungatei]MCA1917181.1 PAS domain-containing sensor histidine kinase [Methanospirillum hungatei]
MKKKSQIDIDTIIKKMEELKDDSSPLARDYSTLGAAYIKHVERMDKILGIADKYYSDLKNTSEQLLLTQEALRENEEKFISIFQETPDPILIVNESFRIIEVNRWFESVFQRSRSTVIGEHLDDLAIQITKAGIQSMIGEIGEPDQEVSGYHTEMTIINGSGNPFTADVSLSKIRIRNEPSLIIHIHDIDDIRKAHNAVSQVNQKLQILASITRHDILNRVMVISAYSEFLKEDITDPEMKKRMEAISKSSEEIRNLINFTKEYQELGSTEPAWQSPDTILATPLFKNMVQGISLDSSLEGLLIYADRMLEKVLYNLIENSLRHGINLSRISLSYHLQENGEVIIWYEDDGGGIIPEEKTKVFKKGFGKNTGMGLFLIREILSITGMSITETGEPGKGVRFEIRVPAGMYRILPPKA